MYKLFPRNLLTFLLLIKYKYTAAVSNPGTNSTPYSVKMFIDEYPQNTAMLPNTPNAISKIADCHPKRPSVPCSAVSV